MRPYSLHHLSNTALLQDLKDLVVRDRATTAALLAHIAEVDTRRLYAPAGYPSMFAYCVEELRLSEGATYKRITAARAARKYPVLFRLVAEGRLHLTAIKFLAPHLTPGNADELLASAVGLGKAELEEMLARRFPDPLVQAASRAVAGLDFGSQLLPAQLIESGLENLSQLVPEPVEALLPGSPAIAASLPDTSAIAVALAPAGPSPRYLLQVSIEKKTREKLHYLQTLLSHTIPSGDVAQVLDRALDALIAQVEKRRFAATPRPQARVQKLRSAAATRLIPAAVRRAVWTRDQGRCTFLGETLQRCRSRSFLEFDHIEPVARGGLGTVENLRLRCRTHNQYEAERVFGAEFMAGKRAQNHRPAHEAALLSPAPAGQPLATRARPAGPPPRAPTSPQE